MNITFQLVVCHIMKVTCFLNKKGLNMCIWKPANFTELWWHLFFSAQVLLSFTSGSTYTALSNLLSIGKRDSIPNVYKKKSTVWKWYIVYDGKYVINCCMLNNNRYDKVMICSEFFLWAKKNVTLFHS